VLWEVQVFVEVGRVDDAAKADQRRVELDALRAKTAHGDDFAFDRSRRVFQAVPVQSLSLSSEAIGKAYHCSKRSQACLGKNSTF
jgi:hypothetical protein